MLSDHAKMSNVYHRKRSQIIDENDSKKPVTNRNSFSDSNNVEETNVLVGLLIFRLCNIVLVQTWFVPDEYWQAPEVAHKMVFGYGYQTWEWKEGIRGYTYPLMFAVLFKCMQFLKLDWSVAVIYSPRILQAICGAVGEFYVYKFAKLVCSSGAAWWVLFCHVTSWFIFYTITRTLTNSMETAFVSVGLYYWQFVQMNSLREPQKKLALYTALTLASLSCLIRPTALIVWIPLGIAKLWTTKSPCNFAFKYVLPVGVMAISFSIGLDSWFYNKFILVQYNFLYYNVMQNIGELYGTHVWHWYFTQGIPVVLSSHLIAFFIGLYYSGKSLFNWFLLILINVSVYSILSHKEFRFILPIVPIFMCICGEGMHQIADVMVCSVKKDDDSSKARKKTTCTFESKMLAMFLIITNIPAALYTGLVHQRGTLDVMYALQNQLHSEQSQNFSVLFLMPCHSTPYYSYIHKDIEMKFLDCSPSKQLGYVDEADKFYNSPIKWLNTNYKNGEEIIQLPSHLVLFDVLVMDIKDFLWEHMYVKCGEFFYSHFPSGRLGKSVLLFCKMDKKHAHL